jgi:hypothetical protein
MPDAVPVDDLVVVVDRNCLAAPRPGLASATHNSRRVRPLIHDELLVQNENGLRWLH